MGRKTTLHRTSASASAAAAAVSEASAATSGVAGGGGGTGGGRLRQQRASSSAAAASADTAISDLGLLLALYQSLLAQLGTNLDTRRVREDLQALRNRAWDLLSLAQQQQQQQKQQQQQQQQQQKQQASLTPLAQPPACLLLAELAAYFADLLLLTHRLLLRFPGVGVEPSCPPPSSSAAATTATAATAATAAAATPIPVGLQEAQRLPSGFHHLHGGRMSTAAAAAAAAAAASAAAAPASCNLPAEVEKANRLAQSLGCQQRQPQQPLQQQPPEDTWSALIRTDSMDSLDSYVYRHEPVLLEIHASSSGRRRRCIALLAVVLLVVTTFAVVLGICITMLTPRNPA